MVNDIAKNGKQITVNIHYPWYLLSIQNADKKHIKPFCKLNNTQNGKMPHEKAPCLKKRRVFSQWMEKVLEGFKGNIFPIEKSRSKNVANSNNFINVIRYT